jgi:hypothetical protein
LRQIILSQLKLEASCNGHSVSHMIFIASSSTLNRTYRFEGRLNHLHKLVNTHSKPTLKKETYRDNQSPTNRSAIVANGKLPLNAQRITRCGLA